VNRLDQHAHAREQGLTLLHIGIIAHAAHRAVRGGTPFGKVDHFTAKQLCAMPGKIARFGQGFESGHQIGVKVGLRPVEQDPAFAALIRPSDPPRQPGHAPRISREQILQAAPWQ